VDLPKDARPGRSMGTFQALRFRDFRLLWIGSFFSSAGQWIQQATLGWVVYDITGSSVLLGAINGMRSLPMLFVSPLGGVAADRINRKSLMVSTQGFLAAISLVLALALAIDVVKVWHLFVFTFLTGIAWAVNMPVRQTVLFSLVPRDVFPNAFALNSVAWNITRILGPMMAGFLISWLGPEGNFFVQGAAYMGVTISTTLIVIPRIKVPDHRQSVAKDLVEGLRYVVKEPVVRILMFMGLFPVFFAMPYMALLPVFAKDVFEAGPEAFGLLLASAGLGGLFGGLVTASLGRFEHRGILQLGAMLTFGIGLLLLSVMHTVTTGSMVLVITGFSQMIFMATNQTLLQLNIPDQLRGRINSIYMLDRGLVPLGTLLAGVGSEFLGAPVVVAIMGATCGGLAILIFLQVPRMRNMGLNVEMPSYSTDRRK
jgi:MFS family permease